LRDAADAVLGFRGALPPPLAVFVLDSTLQPEPDQVQHAPIDDPARSDYINSAWGMLTEVVGKVGVHDFGMTSDQLRVDLHHGLLGISARGGSRTAPVVGQLRRSAPAPALPLSCRPDPQGRDAQRPELATGLRDIDSSDGVRSVSLLT